METFEWRYRIRRDGPLSEPVTVTLTDDEAATMRALAAKMRALPEGDERKAILNEITTFMDFKALFPDAVVVPWEPKVLPDPSANRIGKFHGPDAGAPETQRQSAILIYPNTGTARRGVLDFIAESGEHGATDEEISIALRMRLNTERPRRNELLNDGWIETNGRTRPTDTGTDAAVWVLSRNGREQYEPTT